MSTFSLLQISLDQPIERDFFIDAASVTESLTKVDLSQSFRDLHGIAVSNLSHADAPALQGEWKRLNFPTELVADSELPVLHEPLSSQRVVVDGGWLRFTDVMGRTTSRALGDLVFLAGGHLKTSKLKSQIVEVTRSSSGEREASVERAYRSEDVPEFRMEFFFWSEPNRVALTLGPERIVFFNGKALQLHKRPALDEVAAELCQLLPPERINLGLRKTEMSYANQRAYLEEIRWHFYQLSKNG